MATYTVYEEAQDRSGVTMDDNGYVTGSAGRRWNIASNVPVSAQLARSELLASGQLPRPGSFHPDLFGFTCRGVDVQRQGSSIYFVATASYQSPPRPQENDDETLAPWEQPAEVEYLSVKETIEVDEDVNGDPIVNPGTNEPVTGVMKRVTDLSIRVSKNLFTWNRNEIYLFVDSVNDAEFLGFPSGTVIIDDINAKTNYHDSTLYYIATYLFAVRKPYNVNDDEAWYWRRRLEGFLVKDSSDEIVPATKAGERVTSPVLLDIDGTALPVDEPAKFETTQLYEFKDFTQLSLFS